MKRDGREFFSMREELHNHCLRLRTTPGELIVDAGRRSRALCQKGAIRTSAKIPRAVLQAVSQKRYVTRTRIRRRSVFVDHSLFSAEFVEALLWK
jgi:hypothetical protein